MLPRKPLLTGRRNEQHSKSELAYTAIRDRILSGRYSPGHRLVLSRLAVEFGISVVPVREAVRRLEAEHLLGFERNVGATVTGIEPTEYLYTMQTLSIVESAATVLSLPYLGDAELTEAEQINRSMERCLTDFDPMRFTELNHDFHEILYRQCPNPHLLELVSRGWERLNALRSSTFSFIPGRAARSVAEHAELLTAIRSGQSAEDIELSARAHRNNTLNAYLAQHPSAGIAPQGTPSGSALDQAEPALATQSKESTP